MMRKWPDDLALCFNFFLLATSAFALLFIGLYYQRLGSAGMEIGLPIGITPLITLTGVPLWTGLADATRRHRLVMRLAILVVMATLLVLPLLNAFVSVLPIAIVLSISLSPATSFADRAAIFMLPDQKDMYGRIRLGGTIGSELAASIAGVLVQNHGLRLAFWGAYNLVVCGIHR